MKIRKIALVETKAVRTHVFSTVYLPRMGVSILSGTLKKAGYEVEIFYQELKPVDLDYLAQFDLVGVSSITSTVKEAYRIGESLKSRGVLVVMGGPHVSALAGEALEICDYVVRGEGEITFLNLIETLNRGGEIENAPGVSHKKNGDVTHNPSSTQTVDLEQLPVNDFSSCKGFENKGQYPPVVMFSRGCPFDCSFCSVTTTFGKKYRYKAASQIIEEMEPFLARSVCFIDDNFAAVPKKTKELLRQMIETNKVPLRYSCQLRISSGKDEELLDLMRKTKCRIAYVGLESVNPETLKEYHKGQTVEQISSAIEAFKKYGIGLHGMFILGADSDTLESVENTVDFALESGLDTIQICALTPFPGTAVYDNLQREGRILHKKWELYDAHHVVIRPKNMTPYQLQLGIFEGLKRFYSFRNISRISLTKRWRLKYRLGGRYLVRKWIAEHSSYFDYLKDMD